MPSNHLIFCHPLLFLPSIFPWIRVFYNDSAHRIRLSKYWSFSFSIRPSKEYWGLISFRIKWLDFLAVLETNLDCIFKSRHITLPTKVCVVKTIVFPVVMWESKHKEGWVPKNWCVWTVVLEKTLESPLVCKDIKPVNPKGNQSWIFTGRADVEAETPNTLATWCEELSHLKRPWCCWERLKAGGERDDRGWGGWMALLTQWTWVWVNSGNWW